ncbi:MAG TPA: hypothetical protein VKG45_03745 [Actinomycetes bacterium]|nr:hypothetical protein [Actinomycetes bacterium]
MQRAGHSVASCGDFLLRVRGEFGPQGLRCCFAASLNCAGEHEGVQLASGRSTPTVTLDLDTAAGGRRRSTGPA